MTFKSVASFAVIAAFALTSCGPGFYYNRMPYSWEPDIPFPVEGHVSCSGILDILADPKDQGRLLALEGKLNEDLPEGTQGVPAYVRYNKHWLGIGEEVGVVVPCFVFGWEEYRKVTILRFGFVETLGIHHKDSLSQMSPMVRGTAGEYYEEDGLFKSPLYEFYRPED